MELQRRIVIAVIGLLVGAVVGAALLGGLQSLGGEQRVREFRLNPEGAALPLKRVVIGIGAVMGGLIGGFMAIALGRTPNARVSGVEILPDARRPQTAGSAAPSVSLPGVSSPRPASATSQAVDPGVRGR